MSLLSFVKKRTRWTLFPRETSKTRPPHRFPPSSPLLRTCRGGSLVLGENLYLNPNFQRYCTAAARPGVSGSHRIPLSRGHLVAAFDSAVENVHFVCAMPGSSRPRLYNALSSTAIQQPCHVSDANDSHRLTRTHLIAASAENDTLLMHKHVSHRENRDSRAKLEICPKYPGPPQLAFPLHLEISGRRRYSRHADDSAN